MVSGGPLCSLPPRAAVIPAEGPSFQNLGEASIPCASHQEVPRAVTGSGLCPVESPWSEQRHLMAEEHLEPLAVFLPRSALLSTELHVATKV